MIQIPIHMANRRNYAIKMIVMNDRKGTFTFRNATEHIDGKEQTEDSVSVCELHKFYAFCFRMPYTQL